MAEKELRVSYFTVGEVAKKMKITVRTLQYYDKEGLLKPSAISEGGRRLYSDKDIIQLHQILSLKYLGFSLEDIKTRLIELESPGEVAAVLKEQAEIVDRKIASLSEVRDAITKLRAEILQMDKVDFKKYADIIVLLQMKNEEYWVLKHFDDKMMDHVMKTFDEKQALDFVEAWKTLCDKSLALKQAGIAPEAAPGQEIAQTWWQYIERFTGGDMSLIPQLMEFANKKESWNTDWLKRWTAAEDFITQALACYFKEKGINLLERAEK